MNISPVSNNNISSFSPFKSKKMNEVKNNDLSFKGIYVENDVRLGDVSLRSSPPKFLPKDALFLNDIASRYPNQDCFIRSGQDRFPRLEFREKPAEVSLFHENSAKYYEHDTVPDSEEYPSVPLIIYPKSILNRIIGLPSYISINPSLPYTVKAGYEVHKRLMEKKYQIMDVVGQVDEVNFGEKSLVEKAHDCIDDVETAVTRYLLESAYTALTDRVSAKQLYESMFPRIQSRLDAKRKIDLTTSTAKLPIVDKENLTQERKDICEIAMKKYPNTEENKIEIKRLSKYMEDHGILLG